MDLDEARRILRARAAGRSDVGFRVITRGKRTVYVNDDGTCSIAESYWLPGIYASEDAAWAAFELDDKTLQTLSDGRGRGDDYRPIALEDVLRALDGEA